MLSIFMIMIQVKKSILCSYTNWNYTFTEVLPLHNGRLSDYLHIMHELKIFLLFCLCIIFSRLYNTGMLAFQRNVIIALISVTVLSRKLCYHDKEKTKNSARSNYTEYTPAFLVCNRAYHCFSIIDRLIKGTIIIETRSFLFLFISSLYFHVNQTNFLDNKWQFTGHP